VPAADREDPDEMTNDEVDEVMNMAGVGLPDNAGLQR